MKKGSKKQIKSLYNKLAVELQKPKNLSLQKKTMFDFFVKNNLETTQQLDLQGKIEQNKLHNINLKWPQGRPFRQIASTSRKVNALEITMGFFPKSYLCFASALYLNGLSLQVPKTFYIAKERPGPSAARLMPDLDEFELQEQFMTPPRLSQKICLFKEYRYNIVEREFSNQAGIIAKTVPFDGKDVSVSLTNLERSLIDCAVSPHYAGGPAAVVQAFKMAKRKLRTEALIEMYKKLNLVFPYWQRIGLLLEKSVSAKSAKIWRDVFGKPKMKFYFDKSYRLNWDFNETWQIYHPKGLLP